MFKKKKVLLKEVNQASNDLSFERAFVGVWYKTLSYAFNKSGLPKYLLNILSSFLTKRTFSVWANHRIFAIKNNNHRNSSRFMYFSMYYLLFIYPTSQILYWLQWACLPTYFLSIRSHWMDKSFNQFERNS